MTVALQLRLTHTQLQQLMVTTLYYYTTTTNYSRDLVRLSRLDVASIVCVKLPALHAGKLHHSKPPRQWVHSS